MPNPTEVGIAIDEACKEILKLRRIIWQMNTKEAKDLITSARKQLNSRVDSWEMLAAISVMKYIEPACIEQDFLVKALAKIISVARSEFNNRKIENAIKNRKRKIKKEKS